VSVAVISGPPDAARLEDASLAARVPASVIHESPPDPNPSRLARDLRRLLAQYRWSRPLDYGLAAIQWVGDKVTPIDQRVSWVPGATWKATRIARRFAPDVVLVSGPPFSPYLVGAFVSRLFGVPLILDYRDPWMTSALFRRSTGLRGRLDSWVERHVVRRAGGVTSAHRFILRQLRGLVADAQPGPRFFWVPNGYDPGDFPGGEPLPGEPFTVNYAGALYGTRSPKVLLDAVRELVEEGQLDATAFRLRFAGHHAEAVAEMFGADSSLAKVVHIGRYLPHRESIRQLQESTVNLVIVGPRPGPTEWVPAKLYENLFAGRPLLLLSPEGVPTRLARRSGGCWIAHPEDKAAIKLAVKTLYDAWTRGELPHGPDRRRIAFFDRNHQARRLLRFLSSVAGERKTARTTTPRRKSPTDRTDQG